MAEQEMNEVTELPIDTIHEHIYITTVIAPSISTEMSTTTAHACVLFSL